MAGMLAMFGGSLVSGLAGPLLGMIPNDPNSPVTNPYAGMTSTGGNSSFGPLTGLLGGFTGSGSSGSSGYSPYTSGANSGYYISQAPATTTTTTTSSIDPNIILLAGAGVLLIVLLK